VGLEYIGFIKDVEYIDLLSTSPNTELLLRHVCLFPVNAIVFVEFIPKLFILKNTIL
jgi:hypothetical protein